MPTRAHSRSVVQNYIRVKKWKIKYYLEQYLCSALYSYQRRWPSNRAVVASRSIITSAPLSTGAIDNGGARGAPPQGFAGPPPLRASLVSLSLTVCSSLRCSVQAFFLYVFFTCPFLNLYRYNS